MEWNFELDQESVPIVPPVETIYFESPGEDEFRFDLKLGQMGNDSSNSKPCDSTSKGLMMTNNWKESAGPKSESYMSTKRARANGNANQAASCLVDGCDYDLSNCREYHRRHKVCEAHSKTPVVTINGNNKRFCQQCSRFHSLEEFDEGKRSCRKRLDGHNRRRRKIQPDHNPRSSNFFSDFRGTKFLQFSSSNVFPSTAVGNHSRGDGDFIPTASNRAQSSSSNNAGCKAAFPFLQDGNANDNNRVTFQRNYSSSLSGGDSDYCALSLLSSPSQTQSSSTVTSIGFSHQNATAQQPLAFGSEPSEPVYGSRLFLNASGSDGSVSQAFPFQWE